MIHKKNLSYIKVFNISIIVLIILVLLSCQAPQKKNNYQKRLVDTGQPALHAVHNDQLKYLMSKMGKPAFDRMPQELDHIDNQQYLEEIETVAKSMSQAAEKISDIVDELELNSQEKLLFTALATKLQKQALTLSRNARKKDAAGVSHSLDEIAATCNACHTSFRIMPHNEN